MFLRRALLASAVGLTLLSGCSLLLSSQPVDNPAVARAYEQGRLQANLDGCAFTLPAELRDFHTRAANIRIASYPQRLQAPAQQAFQLGRQEGVALFSPTRTPCDSIRPVLNSSVQDSLADYRAQQRISHLH